MKKRSSSTRLTGLGFEFGAAVAGFALFGYWIGKHYGDPHLGVLIGAVLGIVGGMYNLIRATITVTGGEASQERKSDSDTED
jgi:F0F1-type ATP synthase assembly protein I